MIDIIDRKYKNIVLICEGVSTSDEFVFMFMYELQVEAILSQSVMEGGVNSIAPSCIVKIVSYLYY